MTVVADKWLGGTLQAVEDLLVQCASFRSLMGTSDSTPWTTTRTHIAFQDYRTQLAAPMCGLVLQPGSHEYTTGRKTPTHETVVECYLCWPIDNTAAGTDEKQQALIALNALGNLLDELGALMNTGTNLITAKLDWEPPERTPDNDQRPSCWQASITFTSAI